jgi:hypothetical protein
VWVDRDGKVKKAGAGNAEPAPRKNAEKDVLQNDNGAPYVGVFYLNSTSGALNNGHVAMLLLRSDDTGDLYSYDCVDKSYTVVYGYSDANVNHAYGINLEEEWGTRDTDSNYAFDEVIKAEGVKDTTEIYNRGIYFPIKDADGKKMAQAAKETILSVNGIGYDEPDYHLFKNNCDINARKWMRAGGVDITSGNKVRPNNIYKYNATQIDNKASGYENAMYGDLHDIWCRIHNCDTSN